MTETVRETKRVDELKEGDWTRPGQISAIAAEVLHTLTYPHPVGGGMRTHLVLREMGIPLPFDETYDAGYNVQLATEAELAGLRKEAERAQKIADIRALADWLEDNPDVPLAPYPSEQVDLHDGATSVAFVRELAAKFGGKVRDDLDDRTQVYIKFGSFEYRVIAWHYDGRPAEPESCGASLSARCFNGERGCRVHPGGNADPTGLAYTRADDEPDDPTPVSGARVEPHADAMTDEGLVDETPVEHRHVGGSAGGPGENSSECVCGTVVDGFDSLAEADRMLGLHIEAATSATGLTKAADESRGPLAFTTPVVTYFSFGHGQSDPDSGQSLLDHYVTVVAPTYEACREAMFASRFGRAWSFDYLAGTKRATEWMPRWTEHEVIVAPGTDPAGAEKALVAAADLLLVGE